MQRRSSPLTTQLNAVAKRKPEKGATLYKPIELESKEKK